MKTAPAVLLAVLVALGLGGCSGDSEPDAAPTTESAAPEDAAPQASEGVISPVDLPADPAFRGKAEGVIKDVTMEECTTGPGEVEASGTATNSGTSRRDVVVTVSWTVGSTGDVVAKAVGAVRDLAPGKTGEWSVEAEVPGSAAASCVPLAQAGQLKG